MWQKDFSEISNNTELNENYMNIIKNYKRNKDNNVYLYFQIMFMSIIVIVSFVLKTGEGYIYEYTKDSYNKIFEIESYAESSFSYNSFIEKMKNDLQLRYSQLMEVYNNISGQGSANIYPENVSTKKYVPATKGVVPAYGYISSPYGFRTDPFNKKKKEFHTGIDIAAPKGTFIKSSFDGTVIAAGKSEIAGNYIRIQSDNDIATLYAHNQFVFVKEGDNVIAGQVIATMGDTGRATGSHLHFEFIADGTRYNPIYAIDI